METEQDLRDDIDFINRQLQQLRALRIAEKERHGHETGRTKQLLYWIKHLVERKKMRAAQLARLTKKIE